MSRRCRVTPPGGHRPAVAAPWLLAAMLTLPPAAVAGEGRPALPRWEIGGVAVGVSQQAYPGSDTRLTRGLAAPYLIYRGEVLRADEDTAGVRALRTDRYELDVGFAGAFGSSSDEVPARQGMPRLGTLVEFGPRLKWRLSPDDRAAGRWTLELPVRGVFDVDDGFRRRGISVEPELDYDLRLTGALDLGLRASVIFGDRALADTFYGVAPAFATADRPAYRARAGLVAWRLGASLSRPLGPDWRVFGFVRVDSVHGAANASSPLVRRPTDATAGIGLTWTWLRSASRGSD